MLAGCGSTTSSGRLTASQLAVQGNAICERAATEERALRVRGIRSALPRLEEIDTGEVAALAKLVPPSGERTSYREFVGDASGIVGLVRTLRSSLSAEASPPPELLAHGRELTGRLAEVARSLGMGVCSAPVSPGG
jgi:hypothetical protein